MTGASLERAASLACHTSGDSAVAYAIAFARAVEAALGVEPPPRAVYLRALMAELERIANHLGDFGAICNDASFSAAACALRRAARAHVARGRRSVRSSADDGLHPSGRRRGRHSRRRDSKPCARPSPIFERAFPALVEIYDATASLQDRTVGTGILKPALARKFAAGGYIGRASGRNFDTRRNLAYPPYDALSFDVPVVKPAMSMRVSTSAFARSIRASRS